MNRNANSGKSNKPIYAIIILLLLAIIILLSIRSCSNSEMDPINSANPSQPTFSIGDTNKIQPEDDAATRQQKLNDQVAEGMMTISMNLSPVFVDGTSAGNLLIVNDEGNRYPQVIQIFLEDEKIYESPGIEVGHEIKEDTLAVDLDQGTYDCVAYFIQFDSESGAELGRAAANIKLTVQN